VSNSDLTSILLILLLVALAQLLGYLLMKLRQPKVVGEILAGVMLGSARLGECLPHRGFWTRPNIRLAF
jgi:Kef-type K+ transport system membrane component KefB